MNVSEIPEIEMDTNESVVDTQKVSEAKNRNVKRLKGLFSY